MLKDQSGDSERHAKHAPSTSAAGQHHAHERRRVRGYAKHKRIYYDTEALCRTESLAGTKRKNTRTRAGIF